jgi:hypothetical protein
MEVKTTMMQAFEMFCKEFNLEYAFSSWKGAGYLDHETHKAFMIFKHSEGFLSNEYNRKMTASPEK